MMYWGNGMGLWGYVLMVITMVLFWGLAISGIVALVRALGKRWHSGSAPQHHRRTPDTGRATRPR
jgi:putative membrane protein